MTESTLVCEQSPQRWKHWLLLVLGTIVIYGPMMGIIPYNDGMENFNVLPSMELARDGHWLVPTLWGLPRLEKPPLAEWLSAVGILLGGPLEYSARWVSLVLTSLTTIVVYEWGRLLGCWRTGLVAGIALATTLFFARFGRRAAYDAPLMFFVALTNLAIFWGLLRGQWGRTVVVGGLALGGAMLTKGPPGLLHTLLPLAACAGYSASARWRSGSPDAALSLLRKSGLAIVLMALISALCMMPWVLGLLHEVGGLRELMAVWHNELTLGAEQKDNLKTPILAGLVFLPLLVPWMGWYVGSVIMAIRNKALRENLVWLLIMSALPVAIHACIPPMRERYLLPMVPAAAVAIALVYMDYAQRRKSPTNEDRLGVFAHVAMLVAVGAGYPLYLAWQHGMNWPLAAGLAAAALVGLVVGLHWQKKTLFGLVGATVVGLAAFGAGLAYETGATSEPSRQIAGEIGATIGGGTLYFGGLRPPPRALAIYLNRTIRILPESRPAGTYALFAEGSAIPDGATTLMEFKIDRSVWRLVKLDGLK